MTGLNCAEFCKRDADLYEQKIEALEARIKELENPWVSVDDELPIHSERLRLFIVMPNIGLSFEETGYYVINHGHSKIRADGVSQKPFQRANGDETCMFDKEDSEYFIVTHFCNTSPPKDSTEV